jgi:hypothetical protein
MYRCHFDVISPEICIPSVILAEFRNRYLSINYDGHAGPGIGFYIGDHWFLAL